MVLSAALAALAAAACLVVFSALPARPLQPDWLLLQGTRLLGLGPSLLMACLAIRLTSLLRRGRRASNHWLRRGRLLTSLLSVAFLLLIPLQLISAERILQRQNRQEDSAISATRRAAAAIEAADDPASFRAALAQVVQPQTIPPSFDRPLDQVKADTLAGLQRSIRRTQLELSQTRSTRRQQFWIDALRSTASAALLCVGLAAVARD